MEVLGKPSRTRLARLHDEVRFWLTLDPQLHATVAEHLAAPEPRRARRVRRRATGGTDDAALVHAHLARVRRVRAALTASGVSGELRDSLWRE
jgi:hypothetical protein